MARYSYEFKLMVVNEYLEGPLGYMLLARKYGISDAKSVRIWMNSYKAFGEESLRRKRSIKVYPVLFKLDVLNFKKQKSSSYQDFRGIKHSRNFFSYLKFKVVAFYIYYFYGGLFVSPATLGFWEYKFHLD